MLALASGDRGLGVLSFRDQSDRRGAAVRSSFRFRSRAVNLPLGYVAHFTDHRGRRHRRDKAGEPAIKPDEIKAVLDLSNKGTGVYNVPVQLVAPDVVVQSLSPASVTLTIEKIEQRPFPVTVHYVGAQSSGIVVSETQILP